MPLHGAPQARRQVSFRYKMDTDLFALARARAAPSSLAVSPDGCTFAVASLDSKIRLFDLASGKVKRTFDESVEATEALRASAVRRAQERAAAEAEGAAAVAAFDAAEAKRAAARGGGVDMAALAGGVEAMDFGLRVAVEKELLVRAKASHAGKGGGGGSIRCGAMRCGGSLRCSARRRRISSRLFSSPPPLPSLSPPSLPLHLPKAPTQAMPHSSTSLSSTSRRAPSLLTRAGTFSCTGRSRESRSSTRSAARWLRCSARWRARSASRRSRSSRASPRLTRSGGRRRTRTRPSSRRERRVRFLSCLFFHHPIPPPIHTPTRNAQHTTHNTAAAAAAAAPGLNVRDATAGPGNAAGESAQDPTVYALSFKKRRFYLFSRREPEDDSASNEPRDVINEKPSNADAAALAGGGGAGAGGATFKHARGAILRTTMGDVVIRLFPDEAPLTVENFTEHCRSGYYDGLNFHRVIKGFMIQGGCPRGDGTGGESIVSAPS